MLKNRLLVKTDALQPIAEHFPSMNRERSDPPLMGLAGVGAQPVQPLGKPPIGLACAQWSGASGMASSCRRRQRQSVERLTPSCCAARVWLPLLFSKARQARR